MGSPWSSSRSSPSPESIASATRDIDTVLDAGIDVFSTVNVQHLESLVDQVAELTGVRVRETVPDAVLDSADEVVLIDLNPEALLGARGSGPRGQVPRAAGERLLALVRPQPSSQRLVRRAWRSAQRLGTGLDLLWVRRPGQPPAGEVERQVIALANSPRCWGRPC